MIRHQNVEGAPEMGMRTGPIAEPIPAGPNGPFGPRRTTLNTYGSLSCVASPILVLDLFGSEQSQPLYPPFPRFLSRANRFDHRPSSLSLSVPRRFRLKAFSGPHTRRYCESAGFSALTC